MYELEEMMLEENPLYKKKSRGGRPRLSCPLHLRTISNHSHSHAHALYPIHSRMYCYIPQVNCYAVYELEEPLYKKTYSLITHTRTRTHSLPPTRVCIVTYHR